jgi:hypothetical protein
MKLKLKGDLPVLAEAKVDPSMNDPNQPQGDSPVKLKPCPIDKSLKERLAAGTLTSVV